MFCGFTAMIRWDKRPINVCGTVTWHAIRGLLLCSCYVSTVSAVTTVSLAIVKTDPIPAFDDLLTNVPSLEYTNATTVLSDARNSSGTAKPFEDLIVTIQADVNSNMSVQEQATTEYIRTTKSVPVSVRTPSSLISDTSDSPALRQTVGNANVTESITTSGSSTTAPPAVTDGNVTLNVSSAVPVTNSTVTHGNDTTSIQDGDGSDADHEKEELKKLLIIIFGCIGVVVVTILAILLISYWLARKRALAKKASTRYYNFKKTKSSRMNYDKVLHYQEHHTLETDTDVSTTSTGAAWVFSENETDASKTITLEFKGEDKEKPSRTSGGKAKSKNKNKNNKNRGNYQVVAELFVTRSTPPDVLQSIEGAAHSHSEDDEGQDDESAMTNERSLPTVGDPVDDSWVAMVPTAGTWPCRKSGVFGTQ